MRSIAIRPSYPTTRLLAPRATRMPRPVVEKAIVRQAVNLRPYGNTVTVTTLSDNPFESRRPISVVTQASGGTAKPDRQMQSTGLMHAWLPGVGADPTPVVATAGGQPAGVLDFLATAANTGAQLYAAQQNARTAAAQAAAANAQAQAAMANRGVVGNMGMHPYLVYGLVGVAGIAVIAAIAMRKGKGRRR